MSVRMRQRSSHAANWRRRRLLDLKNFNPIWNRRVNEGRRFEAPPSFFQLTTILRIASWLRSIAARANLIADQMGGSSLLTQPMRGSFMLTTSPSSQTLA